jgi:predicted ATPase
LTCLATSREALALSGELAYRLPSMNAKAAVDLFAARARSSDPTWSLDAQRVALVSYICKELDGIPLAIELAASRVATLGLEALRSRLKGGIHLTGPRGVEARHQTMAATIAWSYDMLGDAEKSLFRRLGVFIGGFTLQAAEYICAGGNPRVEIVAETLAQLVQKSLINVEHAGTSTRYRFLEPIRTFAWERLSESGELEATMLRLVEWLKQRAADLESNRSQTIADEGAELDNIRFVVRWAESSERYETIVDAAQIIIGYSLVWYATKRQGEKRLLALSLLERLADRESPETVGLLIEKIAPVATGTDVLALARRAIPLLKQTGHPERAAHLHVLSALMECDRGANQVAEDHLTQAEALVNTAELRRTWSGILAIMQGAYVRSRLRDFAGARSWLQQVAIPPGDPFEIEIRIILAEIEFREGDVEKAIDLAKRSTTQLERRHVDASRQAILVFGNLAHYLMSIEEMQAAENALRTSLALLVTVDDYAFDNVTVCFARYAAVFAAESGRAELAARLLGACEGAEERTGHVPERDAALEALADRAITARLSREVAEALRRRATAEDLYELLEAFLAQPAAADSARRSSTSSPRATSVKRSSPN